MGNDKKTTCEIDKDDNIGKCVDPTKSKCGDKRLSTQVCDDGKCSNDPINKCDTTKDCEKNDKKTTCEIDKDDKIGKCVDPTESKCEDKCLSTQVCNDGKCSEDPINKCDTTKDCEENDKKTTCEIDKDDNIGKCTNPTESKCGDKCLSTQVCDDGKCSDDPINKCDSTKDCEENDKK